MIAVEGFTVTTASLTTLGASVAGAAAGLVSGAITTGTFKGAMLGAMSGAAAGAFNHVVGNWATTKWQSPEKPGWLTLNDIKNSKTDWAGVAAKSAAIGGKDALMTIAQGGSSSDALKSFKYGAAFGFTGELRDAFVPTAAEWLGTGDTGAVKHFGYEGVPEGAILKLGKNNFGTFQWGPPTLGPRGVEEGGAFSRFMDRYIPGMRDISYVHDVWSVQDNICESAVCATMMLPAAAVSYGALINKTKREAAH